MHRKIPPKKPQLLKRKYQGYEPKKITSTVNSKETFIKEP
jgi:hypothetical protein